MTSKNNPDGTPPATTPYGPEVEAIKAKLDATLNDPPAKAPQTKMLVNFKVENDDLVHRLNESKTPEHNYADGGMLTSQLSIGASFPINKGALKGGSFTGEVSATTATSWGNVDEDRYTHDPIFFNGIETKKPIIDGLQLPTSEKYSLTAAINKPVTLPNNKQLDLGARIDAAYVSSTPYVQNNWHDKKDHAYYLRSQTNTAQQKLIVNFEATGAYHLTQDTQRTHKDITLLGGTSLGNGYQGAMAGADASVGSHSSQYFPQMSHSAQFGNTNPEHVVQGGVAKAGAWKLSAYAKVYTSTNGDYRATMSQQALAPEKGQATFEGKTLTDIPTTIFVEDRGKQVAIPQFETISKSYSMDYSIPNPVKKYDIKPVNFAAGIRAQIQVTNFLNVGAHVGYLTNPSKPVSNPAHQAEIDKIADFYTNKPFVDAYINTADPTASFQDQQYVQAGLAANKAPYASVKKPPAQNPLGNFTGEVSVQISLGGGHKKGGGHAK